MAAVGICREPRLLIAGVQSGVGKTTLSLGLMRALGRRGLTVQPFKVGPDYIDPTYHTLATGRPSRNLDGWMGSETLARQLYARAVAGADVAVVEGVMGLFDGAGTDGQTGSSAQMARWLSAPVVLVVDAAGMGESAGALVQGFAGFDPHLRLAGVIFNRVGSEAHYRLLQESLARNTGVPALGYLPKRADVQAPERHLGLVPALDRETVSPLIDRLAALVEATVDLGAILALARQAAPLRVTAEGSPFPDRAAPLRCRIGVPWDAAFHFYYRDGLDILGALGAELVHFSPLAGDGLPPDIDALYIGGGFPEVHKEALAAHVTLAAEIRAAWANGLAIYAECGGLMYLSQAIIDPDGRRWPMVGLLPVVTRMRRRLAALGYAQATMLQPTLLGPAGTQLKGHEFHWSVADPPPPDWPFAYRLQGRHRDDEPEGFVRAGLLASYLHVHFAANPTAAENFVAQAAARRRRRLKTAQGSAQRPIDRRKET